VHGIQLVNKEVDIPCDGILGRDFLQHAKAKICYESRTVTLNGKEYNVVNETEQFRIRKPNKLKICQIKLPQRTENIVRVPVKPESPLVGMTNRCEIQEEVIMAASLTKVMNGYAMTSILNTNDVEVNMQEPSVELDEIDPPWDRNCSTLFESQDLERKILTQLRLEHLNTEERKLLFQTCSAYQDIFYLPGDRLSSTDAAQHTITVETGTEPINTRPYRLPETQKVEVGEQVKKLLQKGTIEESSSPWNSPILVVPKRIDGSGQQKFRLVVDYKELNEKTAGNTYPLPDITEILEQLGQAKYFSCLDLAMGYHQIDMDQSDSDKSAFSTKEGHWEYKRMPFGLKTAPATFQKMINNVLSVLTGTRCYVFLDDIVLYANSLVDHDRKLRDVFKSLRKHNLKLQLDKCEFLRKDVIYLGHKTSEHGVEPDARKIEVIKNFPTPKTTKQLRRFLGLVAYYRRFVPQFSKIASLLHKLLKRDA